MWDRLSGLDQVTLPIWAAGATIILFLIVGVVAVWRAGPRTAIAASSQAALVLIVACATWSFISQSSLRDRADERRALDARAMDLTARAVMPGSSLACLDALAGETVENACEKAVFATADSAAAAVSYIAARLTLLADATAYADRHDPSYEPIVADWRRKLESDRFGLVAQVMATRDGCTGDQCEALRLLRDTSRVSANLKESAFEQNVARHASAWGTRAGTPVAATNTPVAPQGAPSLAASSTSGPIFPSSASIPPVSIMNAEPTGAVQPVPSAAAAPAAATSVTATAEPIVNPPTPPRRPRRPPPPAAPAAEPPPPAPAQ
jgi:hypothetical protein